MKEKKWERGEDDGEERGGEGCHCYIPFENFEYSHPEGAGLAEDIRRKTWWTKSRTLDVDFQKCRMGEAITSTTFKIR